MSEALLDRIKIYVCNVIMGFESGMYKTLLKEKPDRIELIKSKHHPFITIFRDTHEKYYTSTFNSIIKRDDKYVVETFDKFSELGNHSKQCLLGILANLIVSIHFNLDRSKLIVSSYDLYMQSLEEEILRTIFVIQIDKLFDHICTGPNDSDLKLIPDGEKFIKIEMSFLQNGTKKSINSFSDSDKIE